MGITAFSGPVISYGITTSASGAVSEYNDQRGPSLFDLGGGLMDPRFQFNYDPGGAVTNTTFGFYDNIGLIDYTPSATSSNAIAASQTSTGNPSLTLTATGAGITTGVTIIAPETGKAVTGLIAIDGLCGGSTSAGVQFGVSATVNIWNPATLGARCLVITSSVNDSGGAYTIVGRDVYGFKMTETIVGPNAATVTTQKAFKYIATINSSGTINSTGVYVGTSDTYGLPIRADQFGFVSGTYGVSSQALTIDNSSTFLFTRASSRATQTSTTPDVRGTVAMTPTSTGGQRLTLFVSPSPVNLATITSTNYSGLFGAQFSSV